MSNASFKEFDVTKFEKGWLFPKGMLEMLVILVMHIKPIQNKL